MSQHDYCAPIVESMKMKLAGGECTLFTRHSRVQQLGSAHLSGPIKFMHGQQVILVALQIKSYECIFLIHRFTQTPIIDSIWYRG